MKPKRLELAKRAMRMFSSEKMDSSGDMGEAVRELSFEMARPPTPRPVPISVVMIGGGLLPSREDTFLGGLFELAIAPMFGVSLTIGEY